MLMYSRQSHTRKGSNPTQSEMNFRIADTFTDSLARLTGNEQKAVKTTAFDLQVNPAQPGLKFHRVDKARDPNFWSVRANRDIRVIVHRTPKSLMMCYVDHHDDAYKWAEKRKMEVHPTTGAAQLVEVKEMVKEVVVPVYVEAEQKAPVKPLLFAETSEEDLLSYGVPAEWLHDVRNANEDSLLDLSEHLPDEAAEALLQIAVGETPKPVAPVVVEDPFEHPDAKRRFQAISNEEELELALDFPWDKWSIFLHPSQRKIVEGDYNGPFRVSGTAGTGKTVVAIHRAVFLARANPEARVLLTTFSDTLADFLRTKVRRLIRSEPRLMERLEVTAIHQVCERLYQAQFGVPKIAPKETVRGLLAEYAKEDGPHRFSVPFLMDEWENVVDACQLDTWEAYRDVRRLGRKPRLPLEQRSRLWSIFDRVRDQMGERGLVTRAEMFGRLAHGLKNRRHPPYDFTVVDEAQEISVPQLRFFAAMGGQRANALFFAGDLGQRIFQAPFSWKAVGVDISGRSETLTLNYRTSYQIRRHVDRLLGSEVADVDGYTEDRRGTVSAFNGEVPEIQRYDTAQQEAEAVGAWLKRCSDKGVDPGEMAIFARSELQLDRAREAAQGSGFPFAVLDEGGAPGAGRLSIATMHLAKGLEFRAVAVMACDDEVIPQQERIETAADESDLEEVYDTERHLLYVACTRARDFLTVSGVRPGSEFLDDLGV